MNSIYALVLELERTIRTNTDVADLSRILPIDGGHGDSTEADVERGACVAAIPALCHVSRHGCRHHGDD